MADERSSSDDFCGTTWLPKEFIIALVAAAFSAPFIIKVLARISLEYLAAIVVSLYVAILAGSTIALRKINRELSSDNNQEQAKQKHIL